MPVSDPLGLVGIPCVEAVEEQIDAVGRNSLALIAIEIVDRLELAGRVDQPSDDNVTEQRLGDRVEADLVEQATEDQLRTDGTDRCVVEGLDKVEDDGIVVLVVWEEIVLSALPPDE